MRKLNVPLRVVFYREDAVWVAHCLEFDLMGDGKSKKEALDRLADAIRLQVEASREHNNPENLFKPADSKYFMMFAAGKDVAEGKLHIQIDSVTIDETASREYTDTDSETEAGLALA